MIITVYDWNKPFCNNGSDNTCDYIARNWSKKSGYDKRPDTDRIADPEIAGCEAVRKSEGVDNKDTGKSADEKAFHGKGTAADDLSGDVSSGYKSDKVAEGRFKYIGYSAAAGEYRYTCKADDDVDGTGCSTFSASEKKSGEGGKKRLQGNGAERERDLYKCSDSDECCEHGDENKVFCFCD